MGKEKDTPSKVTKKVTDNPAKIKRAEKITDNPKKIKDQA